MTADSADNMMMVWRRWRSNLQGTRGPARPKLEVKESGSWEPMRNVHYPRESDACPDLRRGATRE